MNIVHKKMYEILRYAEYILRNNYNKEISWKQNLSTLKAFVEENPDLFEHFDLNSFCNSDYKEICKRIDESDKKMATKKKILWVLALLCRSLISNPSNNNAVHNNRDKRNNYNQSEIAFLRKYKEIKKLMRKQKEQNVPNNPKEEENLAITLTDLRSLGIQKQFTQYDLLYNLLIFLDETPRLEYRKLIYNPTMTSINNSFTDNEHNNSVANSNSDKNHARNNYLSTKNGHWLLILDDYKTRDKYGTWYILIRDKNMNKYISGYVKYNRLQPNQIIFANNKGNIRPSNKFSEFLQRMFRSKCGKLININALRKIKENELYHRNNDKNNWSIEQKKEFLKKYFRHSLNTAELYYHKIDTIPMEIGEQIEDYMDTKDRNGDMKRQFNGDEKREKRGLYGRIGTTAMDKEDDDVTKEDYRKLYDRFVHLTLKKFPQNRTKILARLHKSLNLSLV